MGLPHKPLILLGVIFISIYLLVTCILIYLLQNQQIIQLLPIHNYSPEGYVHDRHSQVTHETVISLALGYSLKDYQLFVGSLRHSGYNGNIILGLENDVPTEVLSYLNAQRCVIKYIHFVNCATNEVPGNKCLVSHTEMNRNWVRFRFITDWVESCDECSGPILFTDFGNSYFTINPFAVTIPVVTDLVFFEEGSLISENTNAHKTLSMCKDFNWHVPLISLSIILGGRDTFLQYLHSLMREVRQWDLERRCNKLQEVSALAAHNYLFYDGQVTAHIYYFDIESIGLSRNFQKISSKTQSFPFVTSRGESRFIDSAYERIFREINGVSS